MNVIVDVREEMPRRAGAAPYPLRRLSQVDMAVVHWASAVVRDWTPGEIAAYQTGPVAHLDFPEIAYHFVVTWDGTVYQTLSLEKRAWHAGEWNTCSVGVLACPAEGGLLSEAQVTSLRCLLCHLKGHFGRWLGVVGHSEVRPTDCPGPAWEQNKTRIVGALWTHRR